MSIIYDALKKIEKSTQPDYKVDKTFRSKRRPRVYFIYILSVCLGFFVASKLSGLFTTKLSPNNSNRTVAKVEEKPISKIDLPEPAQPPKRDESINQLKSALVLNGVFFSENESYALINNQILKEGDIIEGAKIKRIILEGVDLEFEGELIRLSK